MNSLIETPLQFTITPLKKNLTEETKPEIKTLNFKKKMKNHKLFQSLTKLSFNKASSTSQAIFSNETTQKEYIIIEDNDVYSNNKGNSFESHSQSISNEKTKLIEKRSFNTQSDEDCVILDKKLIDFSMYELKKTIIKPKFLDFKKKNRSFLENKIVNNRHFGRIKRKPFKKVRKTLENLQSLLKEISLSHNLKVSDETLKNILSEIKDINEKNQENIESISSDENQIKELQEEILKQSALPLVPNEKTIRIGQKYQCKLPVFNQKDQIEIMLQLGKHKIWECDKIKENDFKECKKLVQNILKINSINEEVLCELLANNNYKIQDTVTYCFDNSKNLQMKIMERCVGGKKSSRRTKNSLYSKYMC